VACGSRWRRLMPDLVRLHRLNPGQCCNDHSTVKQLKGMDH